MKSYVDIMRQMAMEQTKARKRPSDMEHNLQAACVKWFRYTYPEMSHSLFAVPNGGRRDKATGGKMKAEGVLPGVSDLILLRKNSQYGALLIEMKYENGKQSESQKEWQDMVEKDGYRYALCRSFEEFTQTIEEYLAIR